MASLGRYTFGKLIRQVGAQAPSVLPRLHRVPWGFVRPGRLEGKTRLLVQMRMARIMGCPVCVGIFPPLARRAGFDDTAIRSALAGESDGLTEEQYGAVSWISAVVEGNGELPANVPEPAGVLPDHVREHLALMARVELLVHATGLMFLPHGWIERAAAG